jgi:hypothetical protein
MISRRFVLGGLFDQHCPQKMVKFVSLGLHEENSHSRVPPEPLLPFHPRIAHSNLLPVLVHPHCGCDVVIEQSRRGMKETGSAASGTGLVHGQRRGSNGMGWAKAYDEKYQREYYYNHHLGVSQWERPEGYHEASDGLNLNQVSCKNIAVFLILSPSLSGEQSPLKSAVKIFSNCQKNF